VLDRPQEGEAGWYIFRPASPRL